MAKLYPPLIEGVVPAFYEDEDGAVKITVPFSMNRAVSLAQVEGFAIKIKTVQSSTYLIEEKNAFSFDQNSVTFILNKEDYNGKLKKGQFYKVQIAYINKGDIGHYSTVGVGKFTVKPEMKIDGLLPNQINMHSYDYTGTYENADATERVYSYQFDVYDNKGNLISTSGEQLHNSSNDDMEDKYTYDKFNLPQELTLDQNYYIQYTVTTINKMTAHSPKYRIMQKTSIEPEIKASIAVALDFENGYVDVKLIGEKNEDNMEEPVTGAFLLSRACEDTDYSVWEEVSRFKLAAQNPTRWLWRDFTVEQGKHYIYSLQQYNDAGLYSNRILSNKLYVDYEYAFLYDGKRQLKIKYNPKMTSFKNTILETKMDTIGSKHPFIFRNGRVLYKEFPISGLMNKDEFIIEEKTTNLTGSNLMAERTFKLKVLEWLTNGEPKLFRSPTEGNYIVRLMNTSLTPNDTLGRMLHTFSCTAYEVAEFNYSNLNNYGFIHLTDPEVATLRFETINFYNPETKTYLTGKVNRHPAYTIRISDMMPGDYFDIETETGVERIVIGVTGSYYIDTGVEILEIRLPEGIRSHGSMTYSYYSVSQNIFNKIANVRVAETPVRQFIGEHDVIKEIEYVQMEDGTWEKNPKVDILEFYNINATKRGIERVEINSEPEVDEFELFAFGRAETIFHDKEENGRISTTKFDLDHYEDRYNGQKIRIPKEEYDPCIYVNENQISLNETIVWDMRRPSKLESLKIGNGAAAEVAYQIRITDYLIEDNAIWAVKAAKDKYLNAVDALKSWLDSDFSDDNNKEESLREDIDKAYLTYIRTLIIEQKKERESEGL